MAVPEQTPYIEHTGNGVTTSFSLGFQCESKDHLIVLVDEIEPPIATWSLTGGNVVFTTAPAAGKKIKLQRNTPFGRTTNYQSFNNSFRPQTVNIDFDRIWLKLQELGVADWLMKLYVDRLHQQQEQKINDLKGYVDDRDDELRAYLMEEIRKQGVALDQLDEYYNYLMQRLAQIAVDKGWDASFVVDASGRTQQEVNDEVVSIFRFGAICDGALHKAQEWLDNGRFNSFAQLKNAYPSAVSVDDSIDTLAMEKALAKIGASGHVRLGGRPVFNREVLVREDINGLRIFSNSLLTAKFVHNGDGFKYIGRNENFGGLIFENILAVGPNVSYPQAGYVPTSTGAGFYMKNAFDITLINSSATNFNKGYYLEHGFNNKTIGYCRFMFNQIGVNFVGMANTNKFEQVKIRENRIGGVVIDGMAVAHPSYGSVYPTKNKFSGYVESNIPYRGGYLPPASDGSNSFGIKLVRTYDNDFTELYMENQEFDVILDNQASYNSFSNTRHAPLGGRKAKIWFKGLGVNYNTFQNSHMIGDNQTDTHVISDHAEQYGNLFDNCIGFNIKDSEISGRVDFINNRRFNINQSGTNFGAITRYKSGYLNNPNASTGFTGIGTNSATLDVNGCGEVLFGTGVTAPTTITSVTGVRGGQILILKNYQPTHPITIKASATGTSGIVLNGRKDCVLSAYSDSITFFVSGIGRLVEIGRTVQTGASPVEQSVGTWTPVVTNSGGGTVATATATGRWVKNGRQLTVWFDVTASGDLIETNYYMISGMPNLPQFGHKGAGQVVSVTNPENANQKDVFAVDAKTSELRVGVSTQANFSNSDSFAGCATYIVA